MALLSVFQLIRLGSQWTHRDRAGEEIGLQVIQSHILYLPAAVIHKPRISSTFYHTLVGLADGFPGSCLGAAVYRDGDGDEHTDNDHHYHQFHQGKAIGTGSFLIILWGSHQSISPSGLSLDRGPFFTPLAGSSLSSRALVRDNSSHGLITH